MGTFGERTTLLSELVGERDLTVSVTFDGPHAVPQHEHPSRFSPPSWAGHPTLSYTVPGTGVKYLWGPLMENHPRWLQDLADHAFDERKRGLVGKAEEVAEDWADTSAKRAPRDTKGLMQTATPRVHDDGKLTYQRIG